jgi:hypothetical protein
VEAWGAVFFDSKLKWLLEPPLKQIVWGFLLYDFLFRYIFVYMDMFYAPPLALLQFHV